MIPRTPLPTPAQTPVLVENRRGTSSRLWPAGLAADVEIPSGNLAQSFEVWAIRQPEAAAIYYYGTEISYGELWQEVERLAAALRARGLVAGDRVLLDMQNCPQFVISFYAVLRADGVVVPINPMYTAEEIGWIAGDSGARMAIVGEELLDRFLEHENTELRVIRLRYADRLPATCTDPLPPILSSVAPPATEWAEDFEAVLQSVTLADIAALGPMTRQGEMIALLPYTSGTTGRPKGCMTSHSSVWFVANAQRLWYETTPDSVLTGFMPFFHVAGMVAGMAHGLCAGAALVLMSRWDADLVPILLRRHHVSWWSAAPTMIVDVLGSENFSDDCFSSIRVLTGGGASMPAAIATQLFERWGLRFCEGYGMTEAISATHINSLTEPKPQCLGLPISNTLSMVVDPDTLTPLPEGEIGEILISGPQIMQGYWNRPDATAEILVPLMGRIWLRSGDLGYVDQDGCYYIVDRLKRMISVSGFKVWPAECEMVLYRHPAVKECAVVAAPDPRQGERVHAIIALKREFHGKTTAAEIRDFARTHLAAYKVPKEIEFRETLPISGSRKIDWRQLQQELWDAES